MRDLLGQGPVLFVTVNRNWLNDPLSPFVPSNLISCPVSSSLYIYMRVHLWDSPEAEGKLPDPALENGAKRKKRHPSSGHGGTRRE